MTKYLRTILPAVLLLASALLHAQNPFQEDDRRDFARTFRTNIDANALVEPTATKMARMGAIQRMESLRSVQTAALVKSGALTKALGATGEPLSQLVFWHQLVLNITALDHAPGAVAGLGAAQEQPGPPRTSRALAMIHLGMFEAANQLSANGEEKFNSHFKSGLLSDLTPPAKFSQATQSAAIVQSAYDLILWLYPGLVVALGPAQPGTDPCTNKGALTIQGSYECSLKLVRMVGAQADVDAGVGYGHMVANAVIAERMNDHASIAEPTVGGNFMPKQPQISVNYWQWQVDPVSQLKSALGGNWASVTSFAPSTPGEYRPSDADSAVGRYKLASSHPEDWPSYGALVKYSGERRLSSASAEPPSATPDLYYIAKFWAYDGTAGLCAPVRLYNEVADAVLDNLQLTQPAQVARYYALVNVAMADAAIAAWDSKYYFQLARPVTAIRYQQDVIDAAKTKTEPTAPVSDLESTVPPHEWFPVGAQLTNSISFYNITPNFPAYPSGHAVFGGALFGVLRQFASGKERTFHFQSDEFNGLNRDVYNFIRCKEGDKSALFCKEREFTLDCAERENADSRVWMGVHWMFDADDGVLMGNRVADKVYSTMLKPVDHAKPDPGLAAFEESESGRGDAGSLGVRTLFTTDERMKLTCPGVHSYRAVLDEVTNSYR